MLSFPDNLYLGIALVAVSLITGLMSFLQDLKSSKIMTSSDVLLPQFVVTFRDGIKRTIPAELLVPGDIIEVSKGDIIPADIRILSASSFKVDNAVLTGESRPLARNPMQTSSNPFETKNLAFYGTYAVEGSAKGLVFNTGTNSVLGRMSGMVDHQMTQKSFISAEMTNFIKQMMCFAFLMGLTFFIFAITIGYQWLDAMVFLIGTVVAMVPEGLIVTVSVSLALSAQKMAAKNCLIKNLNTIETLGSVSVICCDKTGTLTQNKIFATHVYINDQILSLDNAENPIDSKLPGWKELERCMTLCNNAEFKHDQDHLPARERDVIGDPIDAALLRLSDTSTGGALQFRKKFQRASEMPFNSFHKFHLTINEAIDKSSGYFISMKGAPELVLRKCSTVLLNGRETELTDAVRKKFAKEYNKLCNVGERVIAFADFRLPRQDFPSGFQFETDEVNFPLDGLRLLGLVSLVDPPRPGVPEAIQKCRSAGIRVIMITGDHPITAKSIAKEVGIISAGKKTAEEIAEELMIPVEKVDKKDIDCIVFLGPFLEELSDAEIDELILSYNEIVFARMNPEHKLLVVESCIRLGGSVAVTGDEVNDCPAMSKAHVGIAMGLSGCTVSKKTADMILLDDNFATIVAGIEEGRLVFDNLKKSIAYTLSSNIPETIPFLMFITFGMPLALGTTTIICIDLGTDIFPSISLAYEHPESDLMKRPPRNPYTEKLVGMRLISNACGQIGMIQAFAGFFTYLVIMSEHGFLPNKLFDLRKTWDSVSINDLQDSYGQEWTYQDRKILENTCHTAFFVTIVMVQLVDALICKTRKLSIFSQGLQNQYLNAALVFEALLAIFLSYTPGMDKALQMYPLRWNWWLTPVPFAFLILIYDECRKLLMRNISPKNWFYDEIFY